MTTGRPVMPAAEQAASDGKHQPVRSWAGELVAMAIAAVLLVGFAAAAADLPDTATESESQINEKVTDPVSTTWSLSLKNSLNLLDIGGHGDQVQDLLTLQPTMPVWLTRDLKFITRPKFTFLNVQPYVDNGTLRYVPGFGDTILDLALSPKTNPWLIGLGPTFVFPTANSERTGQGKWQVGPAGVLGYRVPGWLATVIAQQWWSFAGTASRSSVTVLNLQYIASYFFGEGWSIGTSPTIKVNWGASPGDQVTLPFGPALGKVVKFAGELPVKFEIQVLYSPLHPESNGQILQVQFTAVPVIPGLLNGLRLGD